MYVSVNVFMNGYMVYCLDVYVLDTDWSGKLVYSKIDSFLLVSKCELILLLLSLFLFILL